MGGKQQDNNVVCVALRKLITNSPYPLCLDFHDKRFLIQYICLGFHFCRFWGCGSCMMLLSRSHQKQSTKANHPPTHGFCSF